MGILFCPSWDISTLDSILGEATDTWAYDPDCTIQIDTHSFFPIIPEWQFFMFYWYPVRSY